MEPNHEATMTNLKAERHDGFTLPELMIVIIIVGILSGISIANFSQRWAQERLLTASRQLQSWIDTQRRIAMQEGKACELSINTTTAELQPSGSQIAINTSQSIPNGCANQAGLNIKDSVSNGSSISLNITPSNTKALRFSFRGLSEIVTTETTTSTDDNGQTSTSSEDTASNQPLVLSLNLLGSNKKRCVKVISPIGLIRSGVGNITDDKCTYSHSF
ncbi:MAG: prepilin-type N-terminal cleavage/methylation domain-containing protein [Synechococcus sp. WH 8007]|nr:prepilin-type N-terminal cleavage/methylation domain-containing protein [Synechococcus sp. WH 8007]